MKSSKSSEESESVKQERQKMKDAYSELLNENKSMKENNLSLQQDLNNQKEIVKEFESLKKSHNTLQQQYQQTKEMYTLLQQTHKDLKTTYANLQSTHSDGTQSQSANKNKNISIPSISQSKEQKKMSKLKEANDSLKQQLDDLAASSSLLLEENKKLKEHKDIRMMDNQQQIDNITTQIKQQHKKDVENMERQHQSQVDSLKIQISVLEEKLNGKPKESNIDIENMSIDQLKDKYQSLKEDYESLNDTNSILLQELAEQKSKVFALSKEYPNIQSLDIGNSQKKNTYYKDWGTVFSKVDDWLKKNKYDVLTEEEKHKFTDLAFVLETTLTRPVKVSTINYDTTTTSLSNEESKNSTDEIANIEKKYQNEIQDLKIKIARISKDMLENALERDSLKMYIKGLEESTNINPKKILSDFVSQIEKTRNSGSSKLEEEVITLRTQVNQLKTAKQQTEKRMTEELQNMALMLNQILQEKEEVVLSFEKLKKQLELSGTDINIMNNHINNCKLSEQNLNFLLKILMDTRKFKTEN
eukprot:TRINITY_DN4076_c0_g1_i2.p1 TRINITY_DN4076_c0_g1~~TRINITY_DN4076_c0_g1_i2.p1  ORF type:complete len:530 (+),score=153.82 TRINITY_DN4076_c0_g1_i2:202-1791(+)